MPEPIPTEEELDLINNRASIALRLYQNPVIEMPNLQLSDFVEATFDGYEEVYPAGFGEPISDEDESRFLMEASPVTFTKGEGEVGNTIQGWMTVLKTTGGDFLVGWTPFPEPFNMMAEGDTFTFKPKMLVEDIVIPD